MVILYSLCLGTLYCNIKKVSCRLCLFVCHCSSILESIKESESLNPVLIQTCDYGFAIALLDNGVNDLNVSEFSSYHFFLIDCFSSCSFCTRLQFHYLLHNVLINLLIEDGANVNEYTGLYVTIIMYFNICTTGTCACSSLVLLRSSKRSPIQIVKLFKIYKMYYT